VRGDRAGGVAAPHGHGDAVGVQGVPRHHQRAAGQPATVHPGSGVSPVSPSGPHVHSPIEAGSLLARNSTVSRRRPRRRGPAARRCDRLVPDDERRASSRSATVTSAPEPAGPAPRARCRPSRGRSARAAPRSSRSPGPPEQPHRALVAGLHQQPGAGGVPPGVREVLARPTDRGPGAVEPDDLGGDPGVGEPAAGRRRPPAPGPGWPGRRCASAAPGSRRPWRPAGPARRVPTSSRACGPSPRPR
jgi:hypothetical protein